MSSNARDGHLLIKKASQDLIKDHMMSYLKLYVFVNLDCLKDSLRYVFENVNFNE